MEDVAGARGARRRERALIEGWITEYHDDLYRLARSMVRDADEAADVVQETLLRVWRHGRLERVERPKAWLCTVLRNVVRNRVRKRSLEMLPLEVDGMEPFGDDLPDEVARRITVSRAIAVLPARARELLVLSYWLGFTNKEAAIALGIAPGTVKSGLHRARERLAHVLEAG